MSDFNVTLFFPYKTIYLQLSKYTTVLIWPMWPFQMDLKSWPTTTISAPVERKSTSGEKFEIFRALWYQQTLWIWHLTEIDMMLKCNKWGRKKTSFVSDFMTYLKSYSDFTIITQHYEQHFDPHILFWIILYNRLVKSRYLQ